MLQVQLFGAFAIQRGARAHPPLGAATRCLASYLFSFPNEAHRRDKLIDLFWGDTDVAQARAGLSTGLWRIRRALASEPQSSLDLHATPQEICLELANTSLVDVHCFRNSISESYSPDRRSVNFEALDRAMDLYTAPFLEEYDEDWVLDLRERLQSLYLRSLSGLMRLRALQQNYEDALVYGRRILASDPMRETVQRAVMLLYVLNGQRVEAIRQFERCAGALRSECDVDPMPETSALFSLIRSGEIFQKLPSLTAAEFGSSAESAMPSTRI
jgi:DNA-binding SARP family transcriptional activator